MKKVDCMQIISQASVFSPTRAPKQDIPVRPAFASQPQSIRFGRGHYTSAVILDAYLKAKDAIDRQRPQEQAVSLQQLLKMLEERQDVPGLRAKGLALALGYHLRSRMLFLKHGEALKALGIQQKPSIGQLASQRDQLAQTPPEERVSVYQQIGEQLKRLGLNFKEANPEHLTLKTYQTLQRLQEHLELSGDEQVAIAQAHMKAIRTEMEKTARQIDPHKHYQEILQDLSADEVEDTEQLIRDFQAQIIAASNFTRSKKLTGVTLDPESLTLTESAGAFQGNFVAHYVPGLGVMGVQKNDSAGSIHKIPALAVHEGIPGHWLADQAARQLKSDPILEKLANILPPSQAFDEGWAAYAELLMLEKGFFRDPKDRLVALAKMYDAAHNTVRVVELLSGQTTPEAMKRQIIQAGKTPEQAEKILKLLQERPFTASSYFLGMAQILQLREQLREKDGKRFDPQYFHDRLLSSGPFPIPTLASILFTVNLKPLTSMPQIKIDKLYH